MTAAVLFALGIVAGVAGAFVIRSFPPVTSVEETYGDRRRKWGARIGVALVTVGFALVTVALYATLDLSMGDDA